MNQESSLVIALLPYKETVEVYHCVRCENKPMKADSRAGLSLHGCPFDISRGLCVRAATIWFERLLACLDAYCWLIGSGMVDVKTLLGGMIVLVYS